MDVSKFIFRVGLFIVVGLSTLIVLRFFQPKIEERQRLQVQAEAIRQDIQSQAELLRGLKRKQEKLQNDSRFVEKIAREDLNYALPGETIFRFVE